MRAYEEYQLILELWEKGYKKKQIARMTGIPRGTVQECIKRFTNLEGLQANSECARKSTPDKLLASIRDPADHKLQRAYAYTLRIYLGDGYIVRNARVYFLRIFLDNLYPNIINYCVRMVQTLLPENRVNVVQSTMGNYVEVICVYKFWPDLFPQHGPGKKHDREIKLTDWQQEIVDRYPLECFRGLYHSDGSRFNNHVYGRDYPRYQFTNNSEGIINLFCHTADLLGLDWTAKHRRSQTRDHASDIFISRREDVEWLDMHVGAKH